MQHYQSNKYKYCMQGRVHTKIFFVVVFYSIFFLWFLLNRVMDVSLVGMGMIYLNKFTLAFVKSYWKHDIKS